MNTNTLIIAIERKITNNRETIAQYNKIIIEYANMDRGQSETNSMIRYEERVRGLIETNEQLHQIKELIH